MDIDERFEMITAWMEHMVIQKGQQPRGASQYKRVVDGFFDWCATTGRSTDPRRISKDQVIDWQKALFYELGNMSNSSRASKLSALRSFFEFLKYAGEIEKDPSKGIPTPKVQASLPTKFSTEELRDLFAAPDISTPRGLRDLAILKTLYSTGLRVSELTGLDRSHLVDTGGYIRVQVFGGKGGKSRTLTMRSNPSKTLRQWLATRSGIQADHDAVFVALQGPVTRLNPRTILDILKKYGRIVGIDSAEVFCHKMRSTYATDLYDSGNDKCPHCNHPIHYVGILEVATMLGHDDPKTTMGYIGISERTLRKTAIPDRRFNEIEGG
jgi:site-specific recombinase XerD